MPQCIYQHLYTPVGLRSISPTDPRYRGRYGGSPAERDGSYHQGPVWGWVLGPYLRARFALGATHEEIYRSLERVEQRLETGCLGTVSEIYDGDPHITIAALPRRLGRWRSCCGPSITCAPRSTSTTGKTGTTGGLRDGDASRETKRLPC